MGCQSEDDGPVSQVNVGAADAPCARFSACESEAIDHIAHLLGVSQSLLVITGAGLSADSGITSDLIHSLINGSSSAADPSVVEVVFSGHAWAEDPGHVWSLLLRIEQAFRSARANDAHRVIAEMEGRFDRVVVLTQNVDGLHQKAGSSNVIAIHGSLYNLRCSCCSYRSSVEHFGELVVVPPLCPECDSVLRPGIAFYGETICTDASVLYNRFLADRFDLVMVVGTTLQFGYVLRPVHDMLACGGAVVEINPEPTQISEKVTCHLPLRAGVALPEIWRRFTES